MKTSSRSSGSRIGITLDLNVTFLHDVEQADLNLPRKIGQFVDREDAAIRARNQAVVHGQFVGDILSAPRGFDRIDIADHVRDRHIRRRQFLDIARFGRKVSDRRGVALLFDQHLAAAADGRVGVVVNFASGHVRHPRIEQRGEHPDQPGLGLSAQSKKNEVMPGKNRVYDLWNNAVLVTDDAGKELLLALEFADQIRAQFVLYGAARQTFFGKRAIAQLSQGCG